MNLDFESIVSATFSSLIQDEKLPDDPTVMSAICKIMYEVIAVYVRGNDSPLKDALNSFAERVFNAEDPAIASMTVQQRANLWNMVSMLKQIRKQAEKRSA